MCLVEALSEQTEFSVGTGTIATQMMLASLSGEPKASKSGADTQPDTLPDGEIGGGRQACKHAHS